MIRIVLYAIVAFLMYRMIFPGKRNVGRGKKQSRTKVRDAGRTESRSAAQARQDFADREGDYIDYEEVD